MSRTNIEINDRLVEEGFRLTHLGTKKELVNLAFEELIKKMKRRKILKYEGKVKLEGNLDEPRLSRV